jgi:hypothetical protein
MIGRRKRREKEISRQARPPHWEEEERVFAGVQGRSYILLSGKRCRRDFTEVWIVNNSLYNWLNEAGIKRVGNPRASDHTDAITLYREKGTDAVMEAYGITKGTLRDWLKDAEIDPTPPKYSPEFKSRRHCHDCGKPLTSVAKELGIPASTLATWKMNAKKN